MWYNLCLALNKHYVQVLNNTKHTKMSQNKDFVQYQNEQKQTKNALHKTTTSIFY